MDFKLLLATAEMTESQMTDITANGNGDPSSPGFEAPFLLLPICDAPCQEDQAVWRARCKGRELINKRRRYRGYGS